MDSPKSTQHQKYEKARFRIIIFRKNDFHKIFTPGIRTDWMVASVGKTVDWKIFFKFQQMIFEKKNNFLAIPCTQEVQKMCILCILLLFVYV